MNRPFRVAVLALSAIALLLGGVFVVRVSDSDQSSTAASSSSIPGATSAIATPVSPQEVSVVPPVASGGIDPGRISIEAIGVSAPIEAKGTHLEYAPFLGQNVSSFGIPERMDTTTWWSDGPKPGSDGMAVVLGHTQVGGGFGVFNNIDALQVGDRIAITSVDGSADVTVAVAEVVSGIAKADPSALNTVLSNAPSESRLALVTCGGPFDEGKSASTDNVVVFATSVN